MKYAVGSGWLLTLIAAATAVAQSANTHPGPASAPPPAATSVSAVSYLLASQADMLNLLPPPPSPDSQAQREDLQAVIEAQREAHDRGTLAHAVADAELNCGRIAEVLGDPDVFDRATQVLPFLNHSAREGASLSGAAKNYWMRTRPYAYSSEVERYADMASDSKARAVDVGSAPGMAAPRADLAHSSYPSGHATFATVCAILLADMIPEKRAELYARALDFAHSRMIVGAHFPTDLEAGRLTGTVAAELLMQNAGFQRDLASARVSLRAALKLPAEPAPMQPGPVR